MDFSKGRQAEQLSQEEQQQVAARKRVEAALSELGALLQRNSQDTAFRDYVTKDPAVARALKHWTGTERLPPEEAAKLSESRTAMMVFHQMTHVQKLSKDAGVPFPYDCFVKAKPLPMSYYKRAESKSSTKTANNEFTKTKSETAKNITCEGLKDSEEQGQSENLDDVQKPASFWSILRREMIQSIFVTTFMFAAMWLMSVGPFQSGSET